MSGKQRPRRRGHRAKKYNIDPFQVFCVEKRQDLAARNPNEPVGVVTSMLASIWRSLTVEEKLPYMEFAKQLDAPNYSQNRPAKRPKPPSNDVMLLVPAIHVVRRGGSYHVVEEMSRQCLADQMKWLDCRETPPTSS